MLRDLLIEHRDALTGLWNRKAMLRSPSATRSSGRARVRGIRAFLDQLVLALYPARPPASGPDLVFRACAGAGDTASAAIRAGAARHGARLQHREVAMESMVLDYDDLADAISQLAVERGAPIAAMERRILMAALDGAIASAVAGHSAGRARPSR